MHNRTRSPRIVVSLIALVAISSIAVSASEGSTFAFLDSVKEIFGYTPTVATSVQADPAAAPLAEPLFFAATPSSANYSFATNTTSSLVLDLNSNAVDMSTGTTLISSSSVDQGVNGTAIPIGFDFFLMGNRYSQFNATTNGLLSLSNTGTSASGSTYVVTGGTTTTPIISAFAADLGTGTSGKTHYKVIGTTPNRTLVVEYNNMTLLWTSSYTNNGTFQVRLYESTGIIEFVYGAMSITSTGSASDTTVAIGFATNTTANNLAFVTSSTNVNATTSPFTDNTIYPTGAIANLNSAADGSRRSYRYTPPTPDPPTSLSFTGVGVGGMTLNWVDSANEVGYAIYRSTDGTNYSYVGAAASDATTFGVTGLLPSTNYFWQVYALSEGKLSTGLAGSQSTNAPTFCGTVTVGPTGTYPTLSGVGGALAAVNSQGLACSSVIELQAAYTSGGETFPITVPLVAGASALNTLTIRPEVGATGRSITSANTTATVDLNGANYVIFDGRPGGLGSTRQLTIDNTSTSGVAVRFINDAIGNVIRYTVLQGVSTSTGSTGGVVLFSTTTGANGNDNNTIDNCDIRDGATTPTNGIASSGTTTTAVQNNSGNTISNNSIFNFYNSTSTSNGGVGINIGSGTTDWTISGNSFFQTATRTSFGAAATVNGILIGNSSGNNFAITGNYIGGTAASAGGSAWTINAATTVIFRGIQLTVGSTTATSLQNNTIQNLSVTTTSGSTAQSLISLVTGSFNVGTVTGNTLGSQSVTGSVTFSTSGTGAIFSALIAGTGTPGAINISNNTIGGITALNTGSPATGTSVRGIGAQGLATSYTINNNTIGSTSTANSFQSSTNSSLLGIFSSATTTSPATAITNNTVANVSQTGTTAGSSVIGILAQGSSGGLYNVTGNTVRNVSNAAPNVGTGSNASSIGISMTAATTTGQTVSQNTVHTLSNSNATAAVFVTGIHWAGPTTGTNLLSRNFVHSFSIVSTNATADLRGINFASGLAAFQNNMVRLGIDGAGASLATGINIHGIYDVTSSSGSSVYHNSVYIGGSGVGTQTGNSYAFRSDQTVNTRLYRDNIFVNARSNATTGGKHYAVRVAGTGVNPTGLTLNNNIYQATGTGAVFGFYGADLASFAAWKTAVGQDAISFNSDPKFLTPTGTSATVDLHINPASATDVEGNGADVGVTDDFDGQTRSGLTPVDIGADAGNFTSAGDSVPPVIAYTPLSNGPAGSNQVLTATITDAGSGVPTAGIGLPVLYYKVNAGAYTGVQGVSIGSNQYTFTFGSAATNGGDIVSYYIVAQDLAGTPNVGASPSGAGGFSANPPAASTPPGSPSTYTAQGTIAGGTYTVGGGGTYATLTAAVSALNNSIVTGAVVLSLTDATYPSETFPLVINAVSGASAVNTLTIKPAGSITPTISGAVASGCLVRLNGADYVTIDGSNGGGSPAGTSRDLTITNTSTTSPAAVCVQSLGTGAGATNNTIKNTNISTGVSGVTGYGISVGGATAGTSGADNDSTTIQNNAITVATVGIYANGTASVSTGGNDTLAITDNTVDSNTTIQNQGIQVGNSLNSSITGNSVSVQSSGAVQPTAISLETGFVSSSVTGNKVTKALATNTGGYGGRGITIGTGTATSNLTIANNIVYGVNGTNWSSFGASSSFGLGVGVLGGGSLSTTTGGVSLYFNSVSMTGSMGSASTTAVTTALYVGSGASALDIRNNILANTQTGTNASQKNYAIFSAVANTAYTNINYNDYYVANTFNAGSAIPGFLTSDRMNLAGIQAGFGQNLNSITADPKFLDPAADLHINTLVVTQVESAGTPIAGITIDVDGDTRNVTTPDIGADEGTFIAPVTNDMQATAFLDPTNGGWKLANTAFAPQASFTNNGTATQTSVPVQYRICTDGTCTTELYNDSTQTIPTIGSSGTSTVTFTSVAGGLPVGVYTIKAKAQLGTDTVPANDEVTGTLNVLGPLAGSYDVPGSYSSLTNPGGLFEALNSLGISSNITINIAGDLTGETGSVALNQLTETGAGAGTYTVTIKPSGAARSITSTSTATRLISLNGADRVTIDGSLSGGTDRSLTLINSNTTTSGTTVVGLFSAGIGAGAVNNTIKNTVIQNGTKFESATDGSFNVGIYADGADIDNLTIQNNLIQRANVGIQAFGLTGGALDNLVIQDNTVGGTTLPDYIGRQGMVVGIASGATITRNTVRNIRQGGNGFGIGLSSGVSNSSVTRNSISNLEATSSLGFGMVGINIATGTAASNLLVANNFVFDIKGTGWTTSLLGDTVAGIRISGTNTGGINVWHNSVNLFGNYAGYNGATISAAIMVSGTTPTALDIRNNILVNTFNNTTVTTDKSYAIYTSTANTMFSSINFNDYFVSGSAPGVLGAINSSDATTLGILQTATGQDATSQNVDPQFVSATDLHLSNPANTMVGGATPIAGVTVDYDNDPRPATTPDIGADEIVGFEGGPLAGGSYYNVAIGVGALGGDVTVTNKLFLLGDVNGGGFTLTLGCDASVSGAGASNFIHSGSVRKEYCTTGAFSYPVGTIDNGAEYSPADVTITALGTIPSSLTVRPYDASLSGFDPLGSLSRNWELTETGDLTATLLFTYLDSDVNGDESDYRVWRREGNGSLTNFCAGSPCVDTVNNVIGPATGVTTFSRWTGAGPLAPTAAEVSLAGRVTTADGRGIRNAVMVLSGNSLTQPMRVVTGSFGYYRFDGLEAGETYVVTVNSKRYMFSVPSRVVNLPDSVMDLDFIALPQE